ncbi:2'-5' RNA ligase family protein [Sphingomonas sp. OK281]|uniref:2'-5' RNA ligase family protein n=1 Tax=Sphingomonas sp. OK281 TaxID=1881067 RepID=UPI0008EA2A18|nr:2'-5' RNA ligase family protein [Sphingomonas sp. OK281]SFN97699.1 2'-5' RNA ligase [Sphingomonas sp. OK281]
MFHRPLARHRLFFAIRPPLPLARQITAAASWFETDRDKLRPEHLHVTIDILDDQDRVSTALERNLKAIGDAVEAAPFMLRFDTVVGSDRSIALRPHGENDSFAALYQRIAVAREAAGLRARDGYRSSPHMTLGYRDGAPFTQGIAPIGWTVDAFVLVHSHVGRNRHDVIGRWVLSGDDDRQLPLF